MKDIRFIISFVLAAAACFIALHHFGDELVAIVMFQAAFLLALLTFDFDWKRLVAHEVLAAKARSIVATEIAVEVPPARIANGQDRVHVPSESVLEHATVVRTAELRRSVTESEKFGITLADSFQKMLFVALFSGISLWVLRGVEKGLVDLVGASPHLQRITLLITFLKVVSAILPIALQLALVWGACLYIRKRNLELSI